jgi:hypothetical protein
MIVVINLNSMFPKSEKKNKVLVKLNELLFLKIEEKLMALSKHFTHYAMRLCLL